MKNKLLAVMAAFGMVASASAVKVNNNLSINGFIDGAYSLTDNAGNAADEQAFGVDEVELNFVVSAGSVSGLVSVDTDLQVLNVQQMITLTSSKLTLPTMLTIPSVLLLAVMVHRLVLSVKTLLVFSLTAVLTPMSLTSVTSMVLVLLTV